MAEQSLQQKIESVVGCDPYVDPVNGREGIIVDGMLTLDELKKLVDLLDKELPNG